MAVLTWAWSSLLSHIPLFSFRSFLHYAAQSSNDAPRMRFFCSFFCFYRFIVFYGMYEYLHGYGYVYEIKHNTGISVKVNTNF